MCQCKYTGKFVIYIYFIVDYFTLEETFCNENLWMFAF